MTDHNEKTLVMGAAIGYKSEQIAPFLISLQKTGYRGDVVLLVDPSLARREQASPLFRGVRLIPVRQWIPVRLGLFKGRGRRLLFHAVWRPLQATLWCAIRLLDLLPLGAGRCHRLQVALACIVSPPTETRYLYYRTFLQRHCYGRVLLTDVRDVLFQTDPFEHLPPRHLGVSMEAESLTVAGEHYNAKWIRMAYGPAMLKKIGDRPISCSGVTYADANAIERYLNLMVREILRLNFRAAGQSGVDQGIHNMLLWTGQLGEVFRLESLASPVATLGGVESGVLSFDAQGRLTNRDGSIVSVVHQYDRTPELRGKLRSTLGAV